MLAFFVLFFGNCVLHGEARDSANIWGGSRVLLVTDHPIATVNVDELYTSLADRGLADVFNRLVIVQRGHDGRFIKSHSTFRALSRAQDRTLSIPKKEILPWLLKEKPNVIICVADRKADVPQMLISAQREGMFPLDTKLMIWMVDGDVVAADGMKMISLISPGDFDSRSSSLDDGDRFASREVRVISARNLESAVIEVFQRGKDDVHHRERRNVAQSVSSSMPINVSVPSSTSAVGQFVSSSITTKGSSTSSSSSSAITQSVSSSMTSKVKNPSSSQSVSSSMTIKVPSPAVGQSVTSSMLIKVTVLSSSPAVSQSTSSSVAIEVPSSSPAVGQFLSSSMMTKVPIASSRLAVSQSVLGSMMTKVPIPRSSPAVSQSVSSSMMSKVSTPSSSPAVGQSVSSSMVTKVSIPSSSLSVSQSVSSSMMTKVPIPSSSLAVSQSVSSSMMSKVSIPSSSPAVGQSVSSSMMTMVPIPSSSLAVSQSVSSSMMTKVSMPSSSPAVSQSVSSSMITKVPIPSSSPAAGQSVSSSMTNMVPIRSSSPAAGQSVSSSMTTMVQILSSSSSASQSVSSSTTTKVSIPSLSTAFVPSVSTSVTTKTSRLSSSPAVGQTVSSSLTSQLVVPSSSVTTSSVVSSSVGQSMSVPMSTKVAALTPSLSVSPSISSSIVVRLSGSESRSSPMIVSSFTETQAATSAVRIKPSSSVASLSSSSISTSSYLPSETLGPPSTSGQKSLVATTLKSIVSSLPIISTSSTPRRSVETSSTPLTMLSSSMASGSTTLSTTTVILATSSKTGPLPSSSPAMVTEKPPVYENETIIIEFEGNCQDVVGNKETKMKFQQELVRVVVEKLGIPENAVVVNDIACGPIRITFTISGTSGKANVSQVLKTLVDNGNISVTVDGKTFRASKLEVVRPTTPSTLAPTAEGKKSEIAFILYITFGALMAFIFIVGFIVLVVRCRRDRREGNFFLPSDAHYELRRFQGIPHGGSNYSRMNYYGEPVEKDAATADPDADDEFQSRAGAYPYDVPPTGGDAVASNRSDAKDEKFHVDALGMPEWKNLPKLSVKEITVAKPSEDIPKSSGSVGSRQLLMDHESPQEDSSHAYDNPVLTFGDGAAGLDKEDS